MAAFIQVFIGLWSVSLEVFLASAQWVGLHTEWQNLWQPARNRVTQPRESAVGVCSEQVTELRRSLQTASRLPGLLEASVQPGFLISETSSPTLSSVALTN